MEQDPTEIGFSAELIRKTLHLVVLVIPWAMWHAGRPTAIWILAPCVILAIGGDILRWRSRRFDSFVNACVGFMMRPSERQGQSKLVLNGATSILCGAFLAVLIFDARPAAAAIAIFVVGDAAAALLGRRFGKRSIFRGKATVVGSSAFAVAGLAVALLIPGLPRVAAIGIVLLATLFEAMPKGRLSDNIVVPFAATACLVAILNLLSTTL